MSKIDSYMDGKELRFKVTIGRKTFKGFHRPSDAFKKGIEVAQEVDPRAIDSVYGKPFERQVAIIFGADVHDKYFNQHV